MLLISGILKMPKEAIQKLRGAGWNKQARIYIIKRTHHLSVYGDGGSVLPPGGEHVAEILGTG